MKKWLKRSLLALLIIVGIGVLVFLLGPKPEQLQANAQVQQSLPAWFTDASQIGKYLEQKDEGKEIREGNYSQVIWADGVGEKTKYVLLYFHGFSASPEEGNPVHQGVAMRYGMNMYAPRLPGMGLEGPDAMLGFTAEKLLNATKEAIEVARLLGDTVVLMSTSTGSTAALFLASGDNDIYSLICYSPNIKVFDERASLLTMPWGLKIARIVKGGNYNIWEAPAGAEKYWHLKYRLEATVELQRLLEGTMQPPVFNQITAPTFLGYYYQDEVHQDSVVRVDAMLEMYDSLGSSVKKKVAFPNAQAHALPSPYFSKDVENVFAQTCVFIEQDLGIQPKF